MPCLARKIELEADWADAEGHWQDGDFPYQVLKELKDGRKKGLSLFEVEGPNDPILPRIAVAFYMGSQNQAEFKTTQFRFIQTEALSDIGVDYVSKNGNLKDVDLNPRHYEINGLVGEKAVALAKLLCQSVKFVPPDDFVRELVAGLNAGRWKWNDLKKDCLVQLLQYNTIEFSGKDVRRLREK